MEELENKMGAPENKERREDIFSRAVRAGKRTYFFDVKATRSNEYYLTITESKRRFNNEQGKFYYEKHKLFLYKEDFDKFSIGLEAAIGFIQTGEPPIEHDSEVGSVTDDLTTKPTNIEFEDLDTEEKDSEI
jgi:hypothetical protein